MAEALLAGEGEKAVIKLAKQAELDSKKLDKTEVLINEETKDINKNKEISRLYISNLPNFDLDEQMATSPRNDTDADQDPDVLTMHRIVEENNQINIPAPNPEGRGLFQFIQTECFEACKRKFSESKACRYSVYVCIGLTVLGGIVGTAVGISLARN